MSSHSSDVYVMEDPVESPPDAEAMDAPPSAPLLSGRTAWDAREESGARPPPVAERMTCTTGVNTERLVEDSASSLLRGGIMALMRTLAGDDFAHHALLKSQRDVDRCHAERVAEAARGAVDSLRELIARQTAPARVQEKTASSVHVADPTAAPTWLEELQQSLSRTDELLQDFTKRLEMVPAATYVAKVRDAFSLLPAAVPATISNPSPPPLQPLPSSPSVEQSSSFSVPPQTGLERVQELENELREVQEKMTEIHLVFAKEGVNSIIPLYNELLALRCTKRQSILRDMESTTAYLVTQENCFNQQLDMVERRKRALDLETSRHFYQGGETVDNLIVDVEKLTELGRKINLLRDEYRRRAADVNPIASMTSSSSPHPGEKRLRTSSDGFRALLDGQLEKDQEIMALRRNLEEQRHETEEWRQRYESTLQTMSRPQESTVFNSLLRDVENRISQDAYQRCTLLCRLFGWELLDLKNNDMVTLARVGCEEEQLTLAIPDHSQDKRTAMATSIVLAKKVLEGASVRREQQQESSGHVGGEQSEENGDVVTAVVEEENKELESNATPLVKEKTPSTTGNKFHESCSGDDDAPITSPPHVEEVQPEEEDSAPEGGPVDSEGRLEPSFYNSNLWDE